MTRIAPPNARVATAGTDRLDDDVRVGLPFVVVAMTVSAALVPCLFPFSEATPNPARASVGAGKQPIVQDQVVKLQWSMALEHRKHNNPVTLQAIDESVVPLDQLPELTAEKLGQGAP
jgi:hypothetical protein